MTKLILALIIGGLMVATVGAYAATLAGTNSAEILGSTGDMTVNAPGVGDVAVSWAIDTNNAHAHFGLVTGATVAIDNPPGAGSAYNVLLRVEDGNGDLLGGGTASITGTDTSASISFGDEFDPKDIGNAIVVIDQG